MKGSLLLTILIVFHLTSCAPKPLFTSNVAPTEIRDLVVFEPISYISLIKKGDKMEFSDTLSNISKKLWLNVVEQNQYRLPVHSYFLGNDDYTKAQLQDEIRLLFEKVESLDKFYSIPLPPMIKSQLDLSENRFGMLTVTSGFTRRKGNMTGQMLKSIGIGVLTLGMVVPMPVTAHSNVYVMILDNELDEVIYYKESSMPESQPLKEKTLHRQLDYLYKNYLW
jgi:hypothetical protein